MTKKEVIELAGHMVTNTSDKDVTGWYEKENKDGERSGFFVPAGRSIHFDGLSDEQLKTLKDHKDLKVEEHKASEPQPEETEEDSEEAEEETGSEQ